MRIISVAPVLAAKSHTLFIPVFPGAALEKHPLVSLLTPPARRALFSFAAAEFRGEEGEAKMLWLPEGNPRRIVLFGLGAQNAWHLRKAPLTARRMVRFAKNHKVEEFAAPLTGDARQFAENALMANFDYHAYREPPREGWPEVKKIALAAINGTPDGIETQTRAGMIIGEEVNAARALANTPGRDMTPSVLAREAESVAKKTAISVKILGRRDMEKLGMGGVLGVAAGSDEEPKFIVLEYRAGPKGQSPLVLAGKGVTFDTGGISLKPEHYMYEMHMDMSGGAAVIHGMAAAARLKLPVTLIGVIPAVENMPSGSSYRPGDLLKSLSGKIIEVLNTDAEGRVILADALTYGLRYRPGLIATFATLTGAAHVALGNYCSALFTNRDALAEKLIAVGTASGDYVWQLPLWDEYLPEIKGVFGDLANIATKQDRYGGAIHGAKFLEQFADETPFAHLDIAPRMTTVESDSLARGASGVGVRYIAELARQYPSFDTAPQKQNPPRPPRKSRRA